MAKYDVVIIGGGPGGYVAAIRGAQLGGRICVIEKGEVGGTCLNWGCIPTKSLIASTSVLRYIKEARHYGINIKGEIEVDFAAVMERKNKVVATLVQGVKTVLKSYDIDLIKGTGSFLDPHKLKATLPDGSTEEIEAEKVIIATGSIPAVIPAFPIDGKKIISSDEAVNLKEVPKSILIIGAGAIGCEFAFILHELGCQVTMVEMLAHAVPLEDIDTSKTMDRELKKRKIKLHCNQKVQKVQEDADGMMTATLESGKEIKAEKVLVSIGRVFNVKGLDLEKIGVAQGRRKEILVNDHMETNVPGVYAIGDVIGGIMLAHVASREGIVAVENALGGDKRIDYRAVPATIFANPEIGSVGLKEREAREQGYDIRIGLFPYRALGKSHAMGEIVGQAKIIADAKTDKILGVHIVGAHATDIIHEAALAIQYGITAHQLGETIHSHPTLGELLMEAAHDVHQMAIDMPKKS